MGQQLKTRSGRPPATTRSDVAEAALGLFIARGFEETTLEDIASAAGISRRTIFRYFNSKNDVVWGTFDEQLERLRAQLAAADRAEPLMLVLRREVVAFNDYGAPALQELRHRMTLITTVPALLGHSMLRYTDWCAVIAEFAGSRLGLDPGAHAPQVIAGAALGAAMASYRHWIDNEDADLLSELDRAFQMMAAGFDERALLGAG